MSPPLRTTLTLSLLLALLIGAIAWRLVIGGSGATAAQTAQLMDLRLTRVLTGLTVGASLAVAGVLLQSLLRNPLASPDLLGLASGSGLGVMLAVYLAYQTTSDIASMGGIAPSLAALVGALAALAVVYLFSQRRGLLDPITLILVGVVVSIMCSAGIALFRHLMPDQGLAASRLLLGALREDVSRQELAAVGGATLVCTLIGVWLGNAMDAAALGDDEARSVGVPLGPLRAGLFLTSGVLTAGAVVLAGPIGFVGLICPHAVRMLAGPAHRPLVAGSAIAGATLVVTADAIVRLINIDSGRLPISILTSLIGGPVLIILLRKEQRGV